MTQKLAEPVIVDAGPLIALANKDDSAHSSCLGALRALSPRTQLFTVSPVLAEAFYLVRHVFGCRKQLFTTLKKLRVAISDLHSADLQRIEELMSQYESLPMDFADATIVNFAESMNISTVFTLDQRDFSVYRPKHIKTFKLLP